MLKKYRRLEYPLNLWSTVLDRVVQEEELPEDWEATLEYMHGTLKPVYRDMLICYFKEGFTLERLGRDFDVGRAAIWARFDRIVSILRRPFYSNLWVYGLEKGNFMRGGEFRTVCSEKALNNVINSSSPILELNLNMRAYYCLKRAQINTVGQLIELTAGDLLRISRLGTKSLAEIEKRLEENGLCLKDSTKTP